MTSARIAPMKAAGTQHQIERINRESGTYQWVRETLLNGLEAKATRIEFGIEWQAVKSKGVYRRTIIDNGSGMSPSQLVKFFNTFGAGSKNIGGIHENFGVGAKTALLPWNRLGVVVISWQGGKPAMIWMMHDPKTGEYGMRVLPVNAGDHTIYESVFKPFNDPAYGVDWAKVKPDWVKDHGTAIILLGNHPRQDTVLGDPYRDEADIKGVSNYLNRRIWDVEATGARVFVTELRTQAKLQWPRTHTSSADSRVNNREVFGACHWIEYPTYARGNLAAKGIVPYSDKRTEIEWYLWEGDRPGIHSYAASTGYIGVRYKNELYDVTNHHATYRSFGISEKSVRNNVWIIIKPPAADPEEGGVYPRTDRNSLLFKAKGLGHTAQPVPMLEWGAWFADNMPKALLDAMARARSTQSVILDDEVWRQKLAERFGNRWKIPKQRGSAAGLNLVTLDQTGTSPLTARVPSAGSERSGQSREAPVIDTGRTGEQNTGERTGGEQHATQVLVAGDLPGARWEPASEFDNGMLAAWAPLDPEFRGGAVILNQDHPVVLSQIKYWQERYAEHFADEVAVEVKRLYGVIAIAKVAHSEHLKGIIPAQTVEEDLRSEAALTMALLGLIAEESMIAKELDSKFRRKRSTQHEELSHASR